MATICSMPGCQTTAGCKCGAFPTPEDKPLERAIYDAFREIRMGAYDGVAFIEERSVRKLSEALSKAVAAEIERRVSSKGNADD